MRTFDPCNDIPDVEILDGVDEFGVDPGYNAGKYETESLEKFAIPKRGNDITQCPNFTKWKLNLQLSKGMFYPKEDRMTVEQVLDRIEGLASDNGMTIYELARSAGVPNSTLYNAFERRTMPRIDTVDKICEALDITMSDFFLFSGDAGMGSYMSEDEIELIEMNRSMTRRNREHLLVYAHALIDGQEPVKTDTKRRRKNR